jgi:hypothetical protein
MRDVYAVRLPFDPGERRAPLARAVVRAWAAGWMGGTWPEGLDPLRGRWVSPPQQRDRVTVSWCDLGHGGSTLREITVTHPHRDGSVRWVETVQVGIDAEQHGAFVLYRSSLRSATPVLNGSVSFEVEPPAMIADLCGRLAVTDAGWDVRPAVTELGAKGVKRLAALLADPSRHLPVIVCDESSWVPDCLPAETAGLAHIVKITSAARRELGDVLGGGWEIPSSGARLFWGRWTPADASGRHPRFGPAELSPSAHGRQWWSVLRNLYTTSSFRISDPGLKRRLGAAITTDRLVATRAKVSAATLTESELDEVFGQWSADTEALQQSRERERAAADELDALTAERDALIEALGAAVASGPRRTADLVDLPAAPSTATTFAEVIEQAGELEGIAVTPQALASVARCRYQYPERVLDALRHLSSLVVRWRADDLPGGFQPHALTLGLPWRGGLSETARHQFAADYEASWNGSTVLCAEHLAFGAKTGPTSHLRLYFHLDKDSRTIVLGPFGRHGRDYANR